MIFMNTHNFKNLKKGNKMTNFEKMTNFDKLYFSVIKKDFSKINKIEFYQMLINQILNDKNFETCTDEIFEIIEIEGLDEEFDRYKKSDWLYINLIIPQNIINKIKRLDTEIIEMLNEFDIILKNRFKMKYIDLINYDTGEITIIKVKS